MFINRRRSLATITASFDRMISDLGNLQGQHDADHADITNKIAALTAKRDAIVADRRTAETIAANMRSLMGQIA